MKIFIISLLLSLVASQSPDLQEPPAGMSVSQCQHSPLDIVVSPQVRDAAAGTTMAGVAALLSSPVAWARVTVTDL